MEEYVPSKTSTCVFMTVLFIILLNWKELKCSSVGVWIAIFIIHKMRSFSIIKVCVDPLTDVDESETG